MYRSDLDFTFNEAAGIINKNCEKTILVNQKEDSIYIDNVVEKLDCIYQQMTKNGADINGSRIFTAISKYFEFCLNKVCDEQNGRFRQLYFVFIVPNEWSMKKDIVHIVLHPLLQHIGVEFSPNPFNKMLSLTQLEAAFSFYQLHPLKKQSVPAYIQQENRCIMYNIILHGNLIQHQIVYFQFKESHDLKNTNGGRFYLPRVISIRNNRQDNCLIDFDYILKRLQILVFKQILNIENLNNLPIQAEYLNIENPTAADLIMNELLDATTVSAIHDFRTTIE